MNRWRKSSRSGSQGACVEVRNDATIVQLRDSKDPAGPVLTFDVGEFRAFVAAIRDDRV